MMETGRRTKPMAEVSILILMELSTMAFGLKINKKVKAKRNGLMDHLMSVFIEMVKKRDKVILSGLMDHPLKVISNKTIFTV